MVGQPAPAPMRPSWVRTYDVSQLLDGTIQVYRRNFILFAAISLVVAVPDAILLAVGVIWPTVVLRFISAPFILAAYYLATTQVVFRGLVGPLPILRAAVRRYRDFAGVLAGYVAAALSLPSAPGGMFLIVVFGPTACVLAAESGTPKQAFKRWNALLTGNLIRAVLNCFALFFLGCALCAALTVIAIVGTDLIPSSLVGLRTLGRDLTDILPLCLVTPLAPIGYCLVYIDLRVRTEGYDLDRLGESAAGAA